MSVRRVLALAAVAVLGLSGCGTGYVWRASVPAAKRTVSVPTFRNSSDVNELGAVVTRQLLREFQREGTFKLRSAGEAAIEVQGEIKSATGSVAAYDRKSGFRKNSYDLAVTAEISVIDRESHQVLIDNHIYTATVSFTAGNDLMTAKRDASGRVADELAQQVVDDILNYKWEKQ